MEELYLLVLFFLSFSFTSLCLNNPQTAAIRQDDTERALAVIKEHPKVIEQRDAG